MTNEKLTERTEKQKSGLANLIDRIKIRYHHNRAGYYLYNCNQYDLDSFNAGISPDTKTRYREEAVRCATNAHYHMQKVSDLEAKYDLQKQVYEK